MLLPRLLVAVLALLALPAEARFGKRASPASPPPAGSHASAPVRGGQGGEGSGPVRMGTAYTRTYVPRFGYGYGYFGYPGVGYGFTPFLTAPPQAPPDPATDALQLRVTAGFQAVLLLVTETGLTVGLHGHLEGERWGVLLAAQNIAVKALDAKGAIDTLQQAQARLTYAFLAGPYGRLRAELGGEVIFAPGFIGVAPTAALSGSLWVGGPVALEASVLVTPFPFWQLDYQAGLAVGLGPVGLRAGWRTQVLDDRGVVDGVIHRDVFMGPYAGVAVVF